MTNTILGHERDVLRLGIQVLALSENAAVYADQIERDHNSTERIKAATRALVDPAKLAEMLAEEGRRLGFDASEDALGIGDIAFSTEPDMPYVRLFRGYGRLVDNWYEWRDLGISQARGLLLQWLQLPDGAREEAEKALRGNNG